MSRQDIVQELTKVKAAQYKLDKRVQECKADLATPDNPIACYSSADWHKLGFEEMQLSENRKTLERRLKELGPQSWGAALHDLWQAYIDNKTSPEKQQDVETGVEQPLLDQP